MGEFCLQPEVKRVHQVYYYKLCNSSSITHLIFHLKLYKNFTEMCKEMAQVLKQRWSCVLLTSLVFIAWRGKYWQRLRQIRRRLASQYVPWRKRTLDIYQTQGELSREDFPLLFVRQREYWLTKDHSLLSNSSFAFSQCFSVLWKNPNILPLDAYRTLAPFCL